MSDKDRILRRLIACGDTGMTRVDFLGPDVVDQGKPIINVPARIKQLRDEGHVITKNGVRNRCAVYVLTRTPDPSPGEPAANREPQPFGGLFAHDPEPINAIMGDRAA